jgi:2-methylisocitrate lyase-like PEP mutase family enzyme
MSSKSAQRALAERFRALHRPGTPFVLGNAWDVASARLFEACGIQAVGTTSAGMGVSLGSGPMRAALTTIRRIVQELQTSGTYPTFTEGVVTYPELQELVAGPGRF